MILKSGNSETPKYYVPRIKKYMTFRIKGVMIKSCILTVFEKGTEPSTWCAVISANKSYLHGFMKKTKGKGWTKGL